MRKKDKVDQSIEDENRESEDTSTHEEQQDMPETKEGDALPAPKARERRKAPTVDEAVKMVRLMAYEDRTAVIIGIRSDLKDDIAKDHTAMEEKLAAHKSEQERLDKLSTIL